VFLAFHGERRSAAHGSAHPEEKAASHDSHGHGHAPHDAPPSMAIPLIVLAIGSIFAGYVGVPHALGGSNRIERFLEPSFEATGARSRIEASATAVQATESAGLVRSVALQESHASDAAESTHENTSTELMLMALSSGVAIAGIGIAAYFWLRNRAAADGMASRFHGLYTLLMHKYYVDEVYDAAIVQPIKLLSTAGLWKGADAGMIDGAVNGVGQTVRATSGLLRRAQTGSVRTYAASLFLGAVVILGWFLLKTLRT